MHLVIQTMMIVLVAALLAQSWFWRRRHRVTSIAFLGWALSAFVAYSRGF